MILRPDIHDTIGIAAFACLGLLLLLLVTTAGMAVIGITPFAWYKPTVLVLSYALPVVFAGLVIVSEVVR